MKISKILRGGENSKFDKINFLQSRILEPLPLTYSNKFNSFIVTVWRFFWEGGCLLETVDFFKLCAKYIQRKSEDLFVLLKHRQKAELTPAKRTHAQSPMVGLNGGTG